MILRGVAGFVALWRGWALVVPGLCGAVDGVGVLQFSWAAGALADWRFAIPGTLSLAAIGVVSIGVESDLPIFPSIFPRR